jgi:transcriptional regulator with XRE-family HTH domain
MKLDISTVEELGQILRAARKTHRLRLDDVAAAAGVGASFASDVERGKETVQFGRTLKLLDELGLRLSVDVPEATLAELQRLRSKAVSSLAAREQA